MSLHSLRAVTMAYSIRARRNGISGEYERETISVA